MSELDKTHIPTKEVKTLLKVSDCDVMHFREAGQIAFKKKGNAFWYLRADIEKLAKKNNK